MILGTQVAQTVLESLVEGGGRSSLTLVFDEAFATGCGTGSEVDDVLLEAERRKYLDGRRTEDDGSIVWWSGVRLMV